MVTLSAVQPPRDKWEVEIVAQEPPDAKGIVTFEYVVREIGGEPFLLNNHRAQLRTDHQRIKLDVDGKMLHVSGAAVAGADLFDFMESDSRAYRWVDKDGDGNWRDDQGRTLPPYLYHTQPWTGNLADEELDPQWQREQFTLPIEGQIDDCIQRYLNVAEGKGWTGDRRGTTLNLQVGAGPGGSGADDGRSDDSPAYTNSGTVLAVGRGSFGNPVIDAWYRFTGVSGLSGATIGSADFSPYERLSQAACETNVYADDQIAPSAPTTQGDHSGRTRTTAFTAADGDPGAAGFHAVAIIGVIQEIADSYDPSTIQILHDNDKASGEGVRNTYSYEEDTTFAAKLDITYEAASAGSLPPISPIRPALRHLLNR